MATRKYKVLNKVSYKNGNYELIPIRDEDKYQIMTMRNEQMYHLRQKELLTKEKQEWYFENCINYYENCLSLPMFPSMADVEQDYVIQKINEFYTPIN